LHGISLQMSALILHPWSVCRLNVAESTAIKINVQFDGPPI
jgi:hypothetical protein